MLRRTLAAGLALSLTVCAGPASAVPKPRADQWWLTAMGVQEAWKQSRGRGVTVALIDTRPNLRRPEFKGAEIRKGRAFDKGLAAFGYEASKDHGTSMLAAMAAQGGGSGYVGAAPDVTVLTIPHNSSEDSDRIVRYAVDQGVDVVNMSFAAVNPVFDELRCDADMEEAIAYAAEHDVVLVAGVGNNVSDANVPAEPAMCPGVVAVAGLARDLKPRKKALEQDYIAVAAPSEDVFRMTYSGTVYKGDGGTSIATAYTSAAIALIRARHPGESARQIVSRLLYTAQDVHTPGRDDFTGYGLVRPDLAMDAAVPAGFANPVYDRLDAFTKKQDELKDQIENPPPFTVGARPPGSDPLENDWQTYGPWLLGGLLALGAAVSGVFVLRRKRGKQR